MPSELVISWTIIVVGSLGILGGNLFIISLVIKAIKLLFCKLRTTNQEEMVSNSNSFISSSPPDVFKNVRDKMDDADKNILDTQLNQTGGK